jgi:hypothetical protein
MRKHKEILINGTEQGIANRFKVQVIERRPDHPDCGKVVRETPFASNLILETGMTALASNVLTSLFTYACVGTGSTPTQASSGSITVTTSGTTATASASIFSSGNVGDLLYIPGTGQSALITAYTDNEHVTLNATLAVGSAQLFTLFHVGQTGLVAEVHRSNTYLTGSGNCGTTYTEGVYTHQRTYDFPVETGSQAYNEVGFSNTGTPGANIFMRGILSEAPVDLVAGQQLRLIYFVLVTVTPISPRSRTVPISGWPALAYSVAFNSSTNLVTLVGYGFPLNTQVFFEGTAAPGGVTFGTTYYVIPNDANTFFISTTPSGGHVTITSDGTDVELFTNTNGQEQLSGDQFSVINSVGGSVPSGGGLSLGEPSTNKWMGIGTDNVGFNPYNTTQPTPSLPTGGILTLAAGSYTAGSYQLVWSGTYSVENGNSDSIFKLFTSNSTNPPTTLGLVYLFAEPQQKTDLFTLTINWLYTWGRIFV